MFGGDVKDSVAVPCFLSVSIKSYLENIEKPNYVDFLRASFQHDLCFMSVFFSKGLVNVVVFEHGEL